jgi:hypothetical protein
VKPKFDDAGIFAEAASDSAEEIVVLVLGVHLERQDRIVVRRRSCAFPGVRQLDVDVGRQRRVGIVFVPVLSHFFAPRFVVEVDLLVVYA